MTGAGFAGCENVGGNDGRIGSSSRIPSASCNGGLCARITVLRKAAASNKPLGSARRKTADGSRSGADGGVQELDNASTQKTNVVFTVEPAEREES